MRRRTFALFALLLLVAGGVAAGTLLATGGGSDSVPTPSGAQNVLRVQPLDDTVACGTAPAVVHIYLDDLEARPSLNDPAVSFGVSGFQVLLRYDPEILRIAQPIDIELNPALSTLDADGDGLARSFFPFTTVDDYAGRAWLGAASFGPGADLLAEEPPPDRDPALNFEEGVDPLAQGEPLLLGTVRFLTVGQGTTALALSPAPDMAPQLGAQLLDPLAQPYEPITLREASLTVEGGDCPPAPPATPRPTLVPTSTPRPTRTPVPAATPAALAPVLAAEGGRTDCPEGWYVYEEVDKARFTVCYPPGFEAEVYGITSRPTDMSFHVGTPRDADFDSAPIAFSMTFAWSPVLHFVPYDGCSAVPGPTRDEKIFTSQIAGRSVEVCAGIGQDVIQGKLRDLGSYRAQVAVSPDGSGSAGYIMIDAHYLVDAAHEASVPTVQQIINSLVLTDSARP